MPDSTHYCRVALPVPLRQTFDYLPPQPGVALYPGDRVRVPFGPRELVGIVVSVHHDGHMDTRAKPVLERLDPRASLPAHLLALCQWLADYYLHPLGEVLATATPPYLRQEQLPPQPWHWQLSTEGKGLSHEALKRSPRQQEVLRYLLDHAHCSTEQARALNLSPSAFKALEEKGLVERADTTDAPEFSTLLNAPMLTLNEEQAQAVERVAFHRYACHLLHGITGSGKTEVYLHLAERVLRMGKQVLVLIPEIGLSPQTVQRFRQRFAAPLVELHSDISDAQRAQNWLDARDGRARIIIGTRLAALAPAPELGLILVDEEHDTAYKQQDSVRYSARDLSIYRANALNVPIVLGSATPSLETLRHALEGRYAHLVLKTRAGGATAPRIRSVDLRNQPLEAGLCPEAMQALQHCLSRKEQALVFLNRRGYAPVQMCHACGWVSTCPSCSASMTLHSKPPRLHCHHCDRRSRIATNCPQCGHHDLQAKGLGTEQLEQRLSQKFEGITTLRIDRDSTRSKQALTEALNAVHSGEPALLVGTQMLAKGHHFANLTLVIVVDADQGFHNPDFRALEKMGQLLMQVAGRAGRGEQPGEVLLQTHRPDHPLLNVLLEKGYTRFARHLLEERQYAGLPPQWHCALFRAESKRAENAEALLRFARERIEARFPPSSHYALLGPLPATMERVQDRFRYQLFVRSDQRKALRPLLQHALEEIEASALAKRVRWSLDVDPVEV